MATKLDKDVIRESSIKFDDRELIITLTDTQEISLKLKGMKSGEVKISLKDLYNQLTGGISNKKMVVINNEQSKKVSKNNPMISLHDIRSYNAISTLDYPTKAKFDSILKNLIDNYPEKYGKFPKE